MYYVINGLRITQVIKLFLKQYCVCFCFNLRLPMVSIS